MENNPVDPAKIAAEHDPMPSELESLSTLPVGAEEEQDEDAAKA